MAIYHFSGTIISRSQGRSVVACAAYRSGELLYDEKYDKDHDYTNKKDIEYSEILLPEGAPSKFENRGILWNAVESFEKRKDAQLAREFNFALPRELTIEQNIALARDFVKENFVDQGMIADLCIHNDKQPDGQFHPHAHVMLTMREVNENGFGQKVREWNDKALLLTWREAWAEFTNQHLTLNGHDLRIDHRSLAEQNILLEPQHKIGAAVARDRLIRLEDHQRIAYENGQKLLSDPSIALHAITRQQSTFTHQDIARFVNRHTLDADQFKFVYVKVKSSDAMVSLGFDDKGRERFTTKEMLSVESKMMEGVYALNARKGHTISDSSVLDALSKKALSTEQQHVFDHLVSQGDLKCVIGFAGTGKSYLLGAARDAWEKDGFTVHGVTLSGIAAENLEGSSGISSRTLASRSYYWDKGEQKLGNKDILVVDEAGMLSSRQMARIIEEVNTGGAKVVLVGDPQQLQAIEAGAAFRAIAERVHYLELTDIRRQEECWQQIATKELGTGKTATAIDRYTKHDHVHIFDTNHLAKKSLVGLWNDARLSQPDKTQIMLAYNRKDVMELNQIARSIRHHHGELGKDVLFQTERGERNFAVADRIYFLKNDRSLGVMNGTLGTIDAIKDNQLIIRLDQQGQHPGKTVRHIAIIMDRYNHLDHGYAATIHKAQGVTVDRSYVLASRYLDSHATYVAMSRHRKSSDLFYSREDFKTPHDLFKTLGRERMKDVTLDYTHSREVHKSFATRYGIGEHKDYTNAHEKLRNSVDATKQAFKERDTSLDNRETKSVQKRNHDDLSAFKKQFETKHPELAKEIQNQMTPDHEKRAIALMHEFQHLEEIIEKGGRSKHLAQTHLETLADKISRKPEVMQYIREHNESMSIEINKFANEFQKQRGLDREL